MPESLSNADTLDTLSTDIVPVQPWSWLPSLPKFPLNWRRRALDDTISLPAGPSAKLTSNSGGQHGRKPRQVLTNLPRSTTLKRQDSERREKLLPFELSNEQRRGLTSRARPRAFSISTVHTKSRTIKKRASEPLLRHPEPDSPVLSNKLASHGSNASLPQEQNRPRQLPDLESDGEAGGDHQSSTLETKHADLDPDTASEDDADDTEWQKDLDQKWILNLSMAFRDKSDREKFFLTYAEEPNRWRRLTVSIDYRNLSEDSLESDLKKLHYQRDKSSRIYESIYDSLPKIRFLDTVTNLKLQTTDGRLHVHVTEDVNEIIPYPPVTAIRHLDFRPQELVRESSLHFDSHLSGFVYKVRYNGRIYIKKEIPAPEMVEEFLYEINALCALRNEPDVIDLEGIVVDENSENIKGLLLSYASRGALIDYIYDHKFDGSIDLQRQEKWARQIINGLSSIHEHGFVQGDFTLSNIVIDSRDNAKVIDINRRGCPVGWEPPEFLPRITNGQRISMFIGVKSDLYQLGMVLWGLCMQIDEPEREEPPLNFDDCPDPVPQHFKDIVELCLRENPEDRIAAKSLLRMCDSATHSSESGRPDLNEYRNEGSGVQQVRGIESSMTDCRATDERGFDNAEASVSINKSAPAIPSQTDQDVRDIGQNSILSDPDQVATDAPGPFQEEDLDQRDKTSQAEDIEIDLVGAADAVLGPGGHDSLMNIDYGIDGGFVSGAGDQFSDPVRLRSRQFGVAQDNGRSERSRTPKGDHEQE